jgi:hypothetical protein
MLVSQFFKFTCKFLFLEKIQNKISSCIHPKELLIFLVVASIGHDLLAIVIME